MHGHQNSLLFALFTLTKPIYLLFPFNSAHIWHVFIRLFILSSKPEVESVWAHCFFCLLHFLSITHRQFSAIVPQQSWTLAAKEKEKIAKILKNFEDEDSPNIYAARPTLLLRVLTPSGFSVIIRALLDSGCTDTLLYSELTTLLLSNGAHLRYRWPIKVFRSEGHFNSCRTLCGIQLQSVEDDMTTISPESWLLTKSCPYTIESTPVDLLIQKMASFGLPMVKTYPMERTMWSKEDPNSQYRVDMVIGQDLLNRFFMMHPSQPTYHLTRYLSITRTKMGLVLSGYLSARKFFKKTLSLAKAKEMKSTLYPELFDQKSLPTEALSSFLAKRKVTQGLHVKLRIEKYTEYLSFLLAIILNFHLMVIFILAILFAFLFNSFIIISFIKFFPQFNYLILTSYTAFCRALLDLAQKMRQIQIRHLIYFVYRFFGCTIDADLMDYVLLAKLPLKVANGEHSKTVTALLDSGSNISFISYQLAEELKLTDNSETEKSCTSLQKFVTLQVSEAGELLHTTEPTEMQFFCRPFQKPFASKVPFYITERLGSLLNIPLHPLPEQDYHILIGTDLLSSQFRPSSKGSPKCLSLAPNLSAIETRFGYYLQGHQDNYNLSPQIVQNWTWYQMFPFNYWKSLIACLVVDLIFLLFFTDFSFNLKYF